jgi:hypothetical protein
MRYLFSELLNGLLKLFNGITTTSSLNGSLLSLIGLRARGAGFVGEEFVPKILAHFLGS